MPRLQEPAHNTQPTRALRSHACSVGFVNNKLNGSNRNATAYLDNELGLGNCESSQALAQYVRADVVSAQAS